MVEMSDLPIPKGIATVASLGARLTPQQFVQFYSPDEWEEFVWELAEALQRDYLRIKRLGGPGDHGVDVAAFKTEYGLEGAWDCFQCKHYANSLMPSDVWPEILKLFLAVLASEYSMPDHYTFVAPKGAGLSLDPLMSAPSKLKLRFLEWLETKPASTQIGSSDKIALRAMIDATDFSRFDVMPTAEVITRHSQSRYHEVRFALPLKPRKDSETPPSEIADDEVRYIDQLLATYVERYPATEFDRPTLSAEPLVREHFTRQRTNFYKAESLRLYSRDSVPNGTFEALKNDVLSGVVEVAEADHSNGYSRLQKTLAASSQLDLSSHHLIQVADLDDRKGMCHQLVNERKLTWMEDVPK